MLVNLLSIIRIEKVFQSLPRCVKKVCAKKSGKVEHKTLQRTISKENLFLPVAYCQTEEVVSNIYQTPFSHLTEIRLIIDARMCTGYV